MLNLRRSLETAALGLFIALSAGQIATAADGVVSGAELSHVPITDRRPTVPMNGEAFIVEFYAGLGDLTAARVAIDEGADGIDILWVDAARSGAVGPRERWSAVVPATTASLLDYAVELIDGDDRDYLTRAGAAEELPATNWWRLDFQTLEHAPLGATLVTGGAVFRVWAPGATSAHVRGIFNSWSATAHPMTRLGQDYIRFIPNVLPGHQYKYYFNNRDWRPDPRGASVNNLNNYNSIVRDQSTYQWRFPDFSPAPAEEWVVYQLHVGTFAGRNDPRGPTPAQSRFRDVTSRVGHLAELGINAVMLNPINEFPGAQSGGYNPISAFALETSYGTPDEFKAMVDTLHSAGIAVILDVVWNHFTSTDNFLWNFDGTQIYFDSPAVGTPWGSQADIDRPQVSSYFFDSMEAMFGLYKLDGYRHDAIYELVGATQAIAGQNLIRQTMEQARRRFPDTHIIGEIYNNSAWNTSPSGIDLDGQYHEAFKNAIKDAVYDAALGDPNLSRLAGTLDGSGAWVDRDRVFNCFELHDEAWPLSGAGRTRAVKLIDTTAPHDDRYALGRTKLANAVTILAQGVPAILMGTEWAEDAGWEVEKIDWSHKTAYRAIFEFYRRLIRLRTQKPSLFANSPIRISHVNDFANVMAWERSGPDGRSYLAVANFSNIDYAEYYLGVPRPGSWGLILNSEDTEFMGRGVGGSPRAIELLPNPRDGYAQSVRLEVPAHGLLLLQHEPEYISPPPDICAADLNLDGAFNIDDLYAVMLNGADVDFDGVADARDPACLRAALRAGEAQDSTSIR